MYIKNLIIHVAAAENQVC